MIRSTQNESISAIAKQTQAGAGHIGTGVKGQSYELVIASNGLVFEVQDEFSNHAVTLSDFPSSAFNGTFE